MKILLRSLSLRFLVATPLALAMVGGAAHADSLFPFMSGAAIAVLAQPYFQSYMPSGTVGYGRPPIAQTQTQPVVYNMPTPGIGVGNHTEVMDNSWFKWGSSTTIVVQQQAYQQPAVVYSSAYPTPPQAAYAAPATMPYVLVR